MTNSMTAYAQAAIETQLGELSCELRSVNHRYLDIAPRMPEELRRFEGDLRDCLGSRLSRGHIDCFIRLREADQQLMQPNEEAVVELQQLIEKMQSLMPAMQPLRAIDVLRWPGMLQSQQVEPAVMQRALLEVLELALDELVAARAAEGGKIKSLIEQRLQAMQEVVGGVEQILPEIQQQYRQKLENKLQEVIDKLEPGRLEQEMILFLQKADVAEEIDRLRMHLDEIGNVLQRDEPAGRRLDFLMQELNREANTLGSKSQDARMNQASVDLKVLIEQMREQVQNLE